MRYEELFTSSSVAVFSIKRVFPISIEFPTFLCYTETVVQNRLVIPIHSRVLTTGDNRATTAIFARQPVDGGAVSLKAYGYLPHGTFVIGRPTIITCQVH